MRGSNIPGIATGPGNIFSYQACLISSKKGEKEESITIRKSALCGFRLGKDTIQARSSPYGRQLNVKGHCLFKPVTNCSIIGYELYMRCLDFIRKTKMGPILIDETTKHMKSEAN